MIRQNFEHIMRVFNTGRRKNFVDTRYVQFFYKKNTGVWRRDGLHGFACRQALKIQCESKKSPPPRGPDIFHFFHKRLRIFNRFFTHLLHVQIYARLQFFIQLSPILTKFCHIKRDYLVNIMCAKCLGLPPAETRAFRRLRKSLIALLIITIKQESRAAARKPRDAASVLFCWSSPTTFTTSIRLAKLRKRPRFRAPNMLTHNAI